MSLDVEHLFPQVGCARSKRQCLTVLQNRRLFVGFSGCGKLQQNIGIQLEKTWLDYQNLHATHKKYAEKVFTNLRHKLNRSEHNGVLDLKTSVLVWGQIMSSKTKSAIHFAREDQQNLIA